ncbi:MAG: SpaH/EbpB family LPXTG-anchored major pilin [Actinomycetaceae bacterium]|nr:SpaH/EbpB family LPXTG-anchored major pilin [Actinomycetaceae bacterium]
MSIKKHRAALALLATSSLLVGGFAVSPVTFAEEGDTTPPVAGAPAEGIPATGTLTIHKRLGLPTNTRSDGTEITDPDGEPGTGINFTVTRIGTDAATPIDLTTQDGWAAISGKKLDDQGGLPAGLAKVTGSEKILTTNANGDASFENLPAGLYLVEEPANQTDSNGNAVTPGAPFLVTVPMTHPQGTGWLDTVHVYPKNQTTSKPSKQITQLGDDDQPGLNVGDNITYDITAPIPVVVEGEKNKLPSKFTVTDKLPAGLGEPSIDSVTFNGTKLTTDQYTVKTYELDDGRWVSRVEVSPATLLPEATESVNLVVKLSAPVDDLSAPLNNTAWAKPDQITTPGWDPENPKPGEEDPGTSTGDEQASVNLAKVTINKTATDDTTKLKGAEFQLHRCDANGKVVGHPLKLGSTKPDSTETPIDTWTTDENGVAAISGFTYTITDTKSTTAKDPWTSIAGYETSTQFCLVETKAPEGYSLNPDPIVLTFDVPTADQPMYTAKANVQNASTSGILGNLPLTGAGGIWTMILVGLGLATAGVAAVVTSRKKA